MWLGNRTKKPDAAIEPGCIVSTWATGNEALVVEAISLENKKPFLWLRALGPSENCPADFSAAILPPRDRRPDRARRVEKFGYTVVSATLLVWASSQKLEPVSTRKEEIAESLVGQYRDADKKRKRSAQATHKKKPSAKSSATRPRHR